jgi:hypothetical protein
MENALVLFVEQVDAHFRRYQKADTMNALAEIFIEAETNSSSPKSATPHIEVCCNQYCHSVAYVISSTIFRHS